MIGSFNPVTPAGAAELYEGLVVRALGRLTSGNRPMLALRFHDNQRIETSPTLDLAVVSLLTGARPDTTMRRAAGGYGY